MTHLIGRFPFNGSAANLILMEDGAEKKVYVDQNNQFYFDALTAKIGTQIEYGKDNAGNLTYFKNLKIRDYADSGNC